MQFDVIAPQTEEDKTVYKILECEPKDFLRLTKSGFILENLRNTMLKYPNSKYMPMVYYLYIWQLYWHDNTEYKKYAREMLLLYPDDFLTYGAIPDQKFYREIIKPDEELKNKIANSKLKYFLEKLKIFKVNDAQ
ncbi:MAG: hypothetical protein HY965_03095 [Ignavibacteriales bacterium]|nr:hypothetical protein [Ignavibacteriales bacterium]